MGGGDWNDGMNEVGHKGKGESVWLGWFLVVTLERFAAVCASRSPETAARYREHAAKLRLALKDTAWDGAWYRRAYFDDGTPLGTATASECRIDSLAQSWAVIANDERGAQAFESAVKELVNPESRVIKLLTPPFDKMTPTPGYIQGYVPGIRENGAQYTHAATWMVLAAALLGDGDKAYALWSMLNPINHTSSEAWVQRYQAEPYVLCGDVYAGALEGRAGWSWYSGSAGWLYRVAIENILGIKRRGDKLEVSPCLPKGWSGFEAWVTVDGKQHHVRCSRGEVNVHSTDNP
jgi:cellobiose phosphorylase